MKKHSSLLKLSASAIKTYQSCPRKYFFSYIEPQPKKTRDYLELGNFVHAVLENFHQEAPGVDKSEYSTIMKRLCQEQKKEFTLTKEHIASSHKMLTSYLELLEERGLPPVIANEQGFSFNLDADDDTTVLRGYIDRIDQETDGFHIIDYKTGKSKYLEEDQLLIYGLYLLNTHPDLERFKGSYLVLSEGSKYISYTFTKTDLERHRTKIRKIAEDIRADQTWDTKPTFLCNYCDFAEICPAMIEKKTSNWSQKSSFGRD